MTEIQESISSLQLSLDLSQLGKTFCSQCDPRVSHLLSKPVYNDVLIDKQLSWTPCKNKHSQVTSGEFLLDRYWCASFHLFPSCQQLAKTAALKLVHRLAQFGGGKTTFVAEEASYKIGKAFISNKCRWATDDDLKQKCTFVPTLAVLSESLESTTKIRICQIPNRPVYITQLGTTRTLNSFIRKTQLKMSSLNLFYLSHVLSVNALFLDFQECFNSLKLSSQTSLQNLIYCLKTGEGVPTYNLSKSDGVVHPLVMTHASFGFSDIPRFTQRCVERLVDVYQQHVKDSTISPELLEDLRFITYALTWVDDSVLPACCWKTIGWAERQDRPPPMPTCSCTTLCKDWHCPTRVITDQDLVVFNTYIQRETDAYLLLLATAMIKVASFSNFSIKHFQSVNPSLQAQLDQSDLLKPKGPLDPRLTTLIANRPSGSQIQSEILKSKNLKITPAPTGEDTLTVKVSQLGKSYLKDKIFLKNPGMYLAYFDQSHKRKSPKFSTYAQMQEWRKENNVEVSRLTMSSFLAQCFDFSGRHLALIRTYLKQALRLHLSAGNSAWNCVVSPDILSLFEAGVAAYFQICMLGLPRSHLYLHPAAGYFLVCTADGGADLHGVTVSLVSYLRLNGIYRALAQHLSLDTYVNHTSMREMMHSVELLACWKMVIQSIQQLDDLERLGLKLPINNVLYLTDSRYVLLILRSIPHFYNKKICTLATKVQQALASKKMNPWDSFAFVQQHDLPCMTGTDTTITSDPSSPEVPKQRFHADILSKTRGPSASVEAIMMDHHLLQCMDWLEQHPSTWDFLSRDSVLPTLSDQDLLQDIGVNADNLGQLKEFLAKRNHIQQYTTFLQQLPHDHGDDNDDDNPDHEDQEGQEKEMTVGRDVTSEKYQQGFPRQPHNPPGAGDDDGNDDRDEDDGEDWDGVSSQWAVDQGSHVSLPDTVDHPQPVDQDEEISSPPPGVADLPPAAADVPPSEEGEMDDNLDRSQWRSQMERLISRKTMYRFNNRGVLNILQIVRFFIDRMKTLYRLPQEEREKTKLMLKERYMKAKQLFSPYCHDIRCAPGNGDCNKHFSLNLSEDHLVSDKIKVERHLLFSGPIREPHLLGAYDSIDESQSDRSLSFSEPFQYNPMARVTLFHRLCTLFTVKVSMKGFTVETLRTPTGPVYLACGRDQRDFLYCQTFEPRFRIIDSSCALFSMCLATTHAVSLGKNTQETHAHMLALNVICPDLKQQAKNYSNRCHTCKYNRALEGRSNYLMQSLTPSPSGKLISLKTASSSFNHVCIDLTGQYFYMTENRQTQGIYFLLCVSTHFAGETKIIPIPNKTVLAILTGLKTLSYGCSTKLSVCLFDAGTEFLSLANQTSPMHKADREPLVKKWYHSILTNTVQTDLENNGIFLQFGKGRHAAVSVVENKVRELKRVLKSFHIFRKSAHPTDLFQIHMILALVHHILATRPICISGNTIYSLHDFRLLLLQGGSMTDSNSGMPVKSQRVMEQHKKLHAIHEQVVTAMMAHHIPSLIKTHHPRESYKQSIQVEQLQPNDIVFDQVGFSESANISGNLGRVIQTSESGRVVLIQKSINCHNDKKFQQLAVSRPCEQLNFICSGNEKEVTFDQKHSLFEFGKYLKRPSSPSTLYALPPMIPPTSDSSPDQTTSVTPGNNVMKIAHISNAPEIIDIARISPTDNSVTSSHTQVPGASSLTATPNPPEAPASPSVKQYTRKGRLRKQPIRLGF